jgi:hypothetical protein
MHGLDQRVFESLVQRCLPMIHDHFQEVDVQLSVASLPWFLSSFMSGRRFIAMTSDSHFPSLLLGLSFPVISRFHNFSGYIAYCYIHGFATDSYL